MSTQLDVGVWCALVETSRNLHSSSNVHHIWQEYYYPRKSVVGIYFDVLLVFVIR